MTKTKKTLAVAGTALIMVIGWAIFATSIGVSLWAQTCVSSVIGGIAGGVISCFYIGGKA